MIQQRLVLITLRSKKAQSILEYAIFASVIVAALMTMATYVKRSIQANLKQVEERVNAEAVN